MGAARLIAFAGLGILVIAGMPAQVRPVLVDRGEQWLSWGAGERAAYVDGFISGYLQGSLRACQAADELFEVGKPHRLGDEQHPSEIPSARCLARTGAYSKVRYAEASGVDLSDYVDVITDFYARHPEYRGVAFTNILELLDDRHHKTADQLYEMALKGELRPVR